MIALIAAVLVLFTCASGKDVSVSLRHVAANETLYSYLACHGYENYCSTVGGPQACVNGNCYCCGGGNAMNCNSYTPLYGCTCENVPRCYDPCGGVYCGAHGSCAYGCSGCSSTACQCPVSGQCTCYDGWSGRDCLTPPDPCIGVSCGVHGSCRSQGQTWYCQCLDGWSGSQCDVAPNPCVYFKVDCSLHGTCKSTSESTYTCTCDSGWTGSNCATQVVTHDYTLVYACAGVGGALVVFGLGFICYRRRAPIKLDNGYTSLDAGGTSVSVVTNSATGIERV